VVSAPPGHTGVPGDRAAQGGAASRGADAGGGYDHVVIDGPPQAADVPRSAIMASDVVIIPVQPSPFDVWGARAVVELLSEAVIVKPNIKAAFAVMRKIVNTAIGRDVTDALAVYRTHVLTASLAQRVAFAESIATGMTVLDLDPSGAASTEVRELVEEIVEFSHGEKSGADTGKGDRNAGRLRKPKA
jgi:chromosome partitioning protein